MMDKSVLRKYRQDFFFLALFVIFYRSMEYLEPLIMRKIHKEELWLYRNPRTPSFFPNKVNLSIAAVVPFVVLVMSYLKNRSKEDIVNASLGLMFSVAFTGVVTNMVKNLVCRPRPDFFERCFPDGEYKEGMPQSCTGNQEDIIEGMKSFPSGHSSLSFSSLGYITLYLCGKLHCFSARGRLESWRIVVSSLPFLLAMTVAISRTADYHHHWQDVLVGSSLGMGIAYVSYRNRYPSLSKTVSHLPYAMITPLSPTLQIERQSSVVSPMTPTSETSDSILKLV